MINIATIPPTSLAVACCGWSQKRSREEAPIGKNETRPVIRGYCSRLTAVCLRSELYNYSGDVPD